MSCPSGKVAYRTGFDAWRARRGYCARKGEAPSLQAYRCPLCGAWHLGRDPKRGRIWRRAR